MVSTGLRELMGSWKIMEILLPRIFCISFSESRTRFFSSKRTEPDTIRPGGWGTSLKMDRAVTLFPQPDSPTSPRVIPREIEKEMQKIRGNRISMIFQEPMSSLNPVLTIGDQVSEVFRIHQGLSQRTAGLRALEMLKRVRIPDEDKCARQYPHELSGGMRQRVMIAMALACKPDLLIADEPTTALDVTVQAQILFLMDELKRDYHSSVLLISHNLGVISGIADNVAVMYAGMIVEYAPVDALFARPLHPYTRGLLRSIPKLEDIAGGRDLVSIPGNVPDPVHYPAGCRFHPRCPRATPECFASVPDLVPFGENPMHFVRCIHIE